MVLRGKAAKGYKDHLLVEASLLSLYFHIEYKDSLNQSNSWIFLFLLFFLAGTTWTWAINSKLRDISKGHI